MRTLTWASGPRVLIWTQVSVGTEVSRLSSHRGNDFLCVGSSVTEKRLAPRLEVGKENQPSGETVVPSANSCRPILHASGARGTSQEALWGSWGQAGKHPLGNHQSLASWTVCFFLLSPLLRRITPICTLCTAIQFVNRQGAGD